MADTKISNLAAVTDVQDTDEFVLARAGVSNKIDVADLRLGLGAMTRLYHEELGGTQATLDTNSGGALSGAYGQLLIVTSCRGAAATTNVAQYLTFNADGGSNYYRNAAQFAGATFSGGASGAAANLNMFEMVAASETASLFNFGFYLVGDYASTTKQKRVLAFGMNGRADPNMVNWYQSGLWTGTAAITRATIAPSSGSLAAGSRLSVYGIA